MLTIRELDNSGDGRGYSFALNSELSDFLDVVKSMHVATILPGCVRGNHYHGVRREIIFVMLGSAWSLYWDGGVDSPVQEHQFGGQKSVIVRVPPGASHAVVNSGDQPLTIVSISDGRYTTGNPDTFARQVAP